MGPTCKVPARPPAPHRRSNRSELAGGWWMRCIEHLKLCGVSVSESVTGVVLSTVRGR